MKPTLLVGKPGIGKTYSVEKYAKKNNLFLVEYNTSDTRTSNSLKDLSVSQKTAATGQQFLYLFDEVDSMDKRGGTVLSKFLYQVVGTNITVFLTANKLDKVYAKIKNACIVENVYPKTEEEISQILKKDNNNSEEDIRNVAKNCNGDIRKAKQMIQYSRATDYKQESINNFQAIKMILYEEDRKKVFKYICQIPIGSLYSWLFETFSTSGRKEVIELLQEVNHNLYKVNETYLYSLLAFGLAKQDVKLIPKLPSSQKLTKFEQTIVNKIKTTYKCSKREGLQYLNLLQSMKKDSICLNHIVKKCKLKPKEMQFLGIDKIADTPKQKQKEQTKSLMEF